MVSGSCMPRRQMTLISSRPCRVKTAEALTAAGVPCTVLLDSAVAYAMEKVDMVLVGSEAVVESGGLINAIGSLNIAIIAKAANKPFYALAERSVIVTWQFRGFSFLSQLQIPSLISLVAI